jgi:hypothetical protein
MMAILVAEHVKTKDAYNVKRRDTFLRYKGAEHSFMLFSRILCLSVLQRVHKTCLMSTFTSFYTYKPQVKCFMPSFLQSANI